MTSFDPSTWENTSVDESGDPPEPGLYQVVIDDARAFTSEKGSDFVAFTFRVAVGEPEGHSWDVLLSFKSAGATRVTKKACARLEMDLASIYSLEELDNRLKTLIGQWAEVAVVESRNPEYPKPSTFINGLVAAQAAAPESLGTDVPGFQPTPAAAGSGQYSTTDDVPFAFEPLPAWATVKGTEWA